MASHRDRTDWTGVGFGIWLGALGALHQFKVPVALPVLLADYAYDPRVAGGFMSVYALAGLFLSLAVGRRMQARGGDGTIGVALVLFMAGSLIGLAVPESGPAVLFGRALEGLGFVALAVACSAIANDSAAPRHGVVAAMLVAMWIPLGQLAATAIGGPIAAGGGWRPAWWMAIALTLATLGMLALRRGRWMPAKPLGSADDAPSPAERRALLGAAAAFALWSTQLFAFLTWTPPYLADVLAIDLGTTSLLYALVAIVLIVGNIIGGAVLRSGVGWPVVLAGGLGLQGLVWLMLPWLGADMFGLLALILFALAAGTTPTCLFALPAIILGAGRTGGRAFGVIHTGRSLGVLAGPVLLPQLVLTFGGWEVAARVEALVAFAAAVLALMLGRSVARLKGQAVVR